MAARGVRILALADVVAPAIYADAFPDNLPHIDLVLAAGDLPGSFLEFVATRTKVAPLYVFGNHATGYVTDPHSEERVPPGGCRNAHLRVLSVAGLVVAGLEGCARYRPGPHQYSESAYEAMALRLAPRLTYERLRGRPLDVLLTHAAPLGPHAGDDHPHRGVPAFNRMHRWWRPRVHVHGHVHPVGGGTPREYRSAEGVRVVNAYGYALIDL